jgi:hypothetical protein
VRRFGERATFAVEIGPVDHDASATQVRTVDLWAAGRHLSCDDRDAFVPAFCLSVEATITSLLSDDDRSLPHPELSPEENHRRLSEAEYEDRSPYRFMNWGPTTDNLSALLFRRGPTAIITFEFWRESHPRPDELGRVFTCELAERELLRSLHQAVCLLRQGE